MASCVHDTVQDGVCTRCRSAVDTRHHAFIPFNYLKKGLEFRPEIVGTMKRHVWKKSLMEKKLTLVLSLHGTLYDSRRVSLLSSDKDKHLTGEVNKSRSDMWRSKNGNTLYKLRPFAREFLREANKLFKMHVFELADHPEHAQEVITSLLDPQGTYFGRRIITKRDCEMKNLDLVLADERGLVILDDKRACWWPDDHTNLLQIRPYQYFKRCHDNKTWITKLVDFFKTTTRHPNSSNSYPEDEDAEDGGLANALELLKEVHHKFFTEEDEDSRDVRTLLFP